MDVIAPIFPVLAVVLGLLLGSFYNVCIHRWLTGESVVFPGSKCPHCQKPLRWWENIPLLSFIILRGRCSGCKTPISWRYPVVEALSGLWALALALKFPFAPDTLPIFILYMMLGGMLLVASFIDFASFILPDVLTLPGAAIAFVGTWLFVYPALGTPSPLESALGGLVGAGVFWGLGAIFRKVKGIDGLGFGDVKLMLFLGAMCGLRALPILTLVSALAALVAALYYLRRPNAEGARTLIPFGPFLSLGGMLTLLYGDYYWAFVGARQL